METIEFWQKHPDGTFGKIIIPRVETLNYLNTTENKWLPFSNSKKIYIHNVCQKALSLFYLHEIKCKHIIVSIRSIYTRQISTKVKPIFCLKYISFLDGYFKDYCREENPISSTQTSINVSLQFRLAAQGRPNKSYCHFPCIVINIWLTE